jgi:uncharacterized phiE125 gp8 family phage protein
VSAPVLYTAPTIEPSTVAECKRWARIDGNEHNDLIEALIATARQECENALGRSLLTTTWKLYLDEFPVCDYIELPWAAPLASVSSITYTDTAGSSQTMTATTDYKADTYCEPGRVYLPQGVSWPSTYDEPNVVCITYVAGWAAATSVPAAIRSWVMARVATLYDQSVGIVTGTISTVIPGRHLDGLLDRYRLPAIAG